MSASMEKFQQEMREVIQKMEELREESRIRVEEWRSKREKTMAARAIQRSKKRLPKTKIKRKKGVAMEAGESKNEKEKKKKRKIGRKKKLTKMRKRRKSDGHGGQKKRIKMKREKGRTRTEGKAVRMTGIFTGGRNRSNKTFDHQNKSRTSWWLDGLVRFEQAPWRMRIGGDDDQKLGIFLGGRFRGGGGSWLKEVRKRRQSREHVGVSKLIQGTRVCWEIRKSVKRKRHGGVKGLGFGGTRERNLEVKPFCVDESWGVRKLEERERRRRRRRQGREKQGEEEKWRNIWSGYPKNIGPREKGEERERGARWAIECGGGLGSLKNGEIKDREEGKT